MKILQINSFYQKGGTEQVVSIIKNGLRKKGFDVFGLYGEETQDKRNEFFIPNIDESYNLEKIQGIVKKIAPNLIFVHNIFNPKIVNFLAKQKSVRFVHDVRLFCPTGLKRKNNKSYCSKNFSPYCLYSMFTRRCYPYKNILKTFKIYFKSRLSFLVSKNFRYFVVDSNYMKDQLEKNGLVGEIFKISPPSSFKPEQKNNFDSNEVLFVGRSDKIKGIEFLLESIKLVKSPGIKFLFVGFDKDKDKYFYNKARKIGVEGKVKFISNIIHEEMPGYYKRALFFVFPSQCIESLGMVGPEAISFGLPCIGLDAFGNREWLKDQENGFLVEDINPEYFASKIDELINNPTLLKKFSTNSLKTAENFRKDNYINELVKFINNVKWN